MVRVFEVALPLDHTSDHLVSTASRLLGVKSGDVVAYHIRRQAVDARHRTSVRFVYTLDVELRNERLVSVKGTTRVAPVTDEPYRQAQPGTEPLRHPPVIVGCGPCGLFAALTLARAGYRPIVLERGKPVNERARDVELFWASGALNPESNVQFGEGGAGTFSDGKLTTRINDSRCRAVLQTLVAAGAPESVLTAAKPHIGTDRLRAVVTSLRDQIVERGGEVRFGNRVTGLRTENAALRGLVVDEEALVEGRVAIVAIGHSARDTCKMLHDSGLDIRPKPFAMGVRIEHPQHLIDQARYGAFTGHPRLGAADYQLAWHGPHGRSAYTFCMCPGGQVIAASSEEGAVVTNGMSLHARGGPNANAALLVNVTPGDFGSEHPLAGFAFQRTWERRAHARGGDGFAAPVQLLRDLRAGKRSTAFRAVSPTYRPGVVPADLRECLPAFVYDTIAQSVAHLGRRLRGFDHGDAVMTAVETRSSSPVRLVRDRDCRSVIDGLYPAGEGAGYAGGIMSSAVDGMRVAEAVISRYAPPP